MEGKRKYGAFLVLSWLLLLFLPAKLNFISYGILGVSIFLFMVGYFNLGSMIEACSESLGHTRVFVAMEIISLIVLSLGPLLLFLSGSNAKSLICSFIFLFEGIILMMTSGAGTLDLKVERIFSYIIRIFALCLMAFGVTTLLSGNIIASMIDLLEGIMVWIAGDVSTFRERIEGMKLPSRDLYEACKNENTPLGTARLDSVGKRKECIVFGPDESGLFVYGYYRAGRFYVALGETEEKKRDLDVSDILTDYKEFFAKYAI